MTTPLRRSARIKARAEEAEEDFLERYRDLVEEIDTCYNTIEKRLQNISEIAKTRILGLLRGRLEDFKDAYEEFTGKTAEWIHTRDTREEELSEPTQGKEAAALGEDTMDEVGAMYHSHLKRCQHPGEVETMGYREKKPAPRKRRRSPEPFDDEFDEEEHDEPKLEPMYNSRFRRSTKGSVRVRTESQRFSCCNFCATSGEYESDMTGAC
ncbi:uncharacterized protein EV422DRAFT_613753 [Fimicolochytrium jonesii]|uniref:uncharacterized protein n=1 Tax=Fimicolochytrium jonesii TaxID=1396493 RepID=UPI0022FEF9ED|nr:uncharacterized protein EV422DRAFT_613753 [Fimicolochytrium jonesii]KAI8822530.1 hypothetical protein EV422DRAFT_613753 [Fimicolochytrium jonesii]